MKKLSTPWHGPYIIHKLILPSTYLLKDDKKVLDHPVSDRRLKNYIEREDPPMETPEPNDPEFDVSPTNLSV